MKKNIIIIILSISVISLFSYIIYDKITDNKEQNITNQEELKESNKEQDKIENEYINNNNNLNNNDNSLNNNQVIEQEQNYTEEDIISYFTNLDSQVTSYDNNQSPSKSIKEKFVTCIDFIFYDKEIGGKTFKELTNSTKLKILEITMSIDSKIENKFPGYKETINSKYQDIKTKIIQLYLETTTNICNNEKDLCIKAKEGFQDLKDNFGITWDLIKSLVGTGKSKLKEWYEIWKYK